MIAFGRLSIGTRFIYNGCTWTKHAHHGARQPGGSSYPFPAALRVTLAP